MKLYDKMLQKLSLSFHDKRIEGDYQASIQPFNQANHRVIYLLHDNKLIFLLVLSDFAFHNPGCLSDPQGLGRILYLSNFNCSEHGDEYSLIPYVIHIKEQEVRQISSILGLSVEGCDLCTWDS